MEASISFVDSCSPIVNLFLPNRIVARALCSSLNQCWLILVGTHEIKGQAIPVKAWPTKAKLNMDSDERPSLKWGRVLRQQRSPPGIIEMTIIRMKQIEDMYALQSLTGKYRGLQGNPCDESRVPVMRTGVPCNENRFFPVRINLKGVTCKPYRVWICNVS